MPGVVLLLAAVVVNYRRHVTGRTTICQEAREHLPRAAADALVVGVFAWLLPHVHRGYRDTRH